MTAGRVDIFAPVWQDLDSLVFANMGIGTSTRVESLYNLGVGFRTKLDSESDLRRLRQLRPGAAPGQQPFDQANFGAELMSADWDVGLNGYLADSARKAKPAPTDLYVSGNRIAVLRAKTSPIPASTAKSATASSVPIRPMCACSWAAST